jgi:hypothetical protein
MIHWHHMPAEGNEDALAKALEHKRVQLHNVNFSPLPFHLV